MRVGYAPFRPPYRKFYRDVGRIAIALERIADVLEREPERVEDAGVRTPVTDVGETVRRLVESFLHDQLKRR